ncbi:MAG: sugar ABC transporter ATP-binding protein, partial [Prevotellaceae bacterium]|nr:sugar ABC transporter ATP-binding protein [Prevotellaceae bacterium]
MSQQPPVALEARKITKRFAGVVALRDVDLRLYAGKVNAIVGENGAGKSTLMNILSGVYADYEGELLVGGGAPRHFASTTEACRAGIAMIHQELNLVGGLSVAENIFLGREPLTALGLIDYPRMRREAAEVLRRLRFAESPDARVGALRVGQQQLVEIAKALARNARILIMDEPTSSLAEGEVAVLFDVIRALTARGVAIGYITHKMGELAQLADYVTVLRDGCLVHAAPARELSADELVRLMVGRDPADFFARGDHPAGPRVLEAEGITLRDPARPGRRLLDGVSLHAAAGEVLGLYGLMGAGRTELLETLFGLHPAEATGALRLGGSPARLGSPAQAIAHGVALVPEDRKGDGLVLGMSIAQNTTLAALGAALRGGLISPRRERGVADEWRARLGIKSHSARQPAASLSGGNQQKVVLA